MYVKATWSYFENFEISDFPRLFCTGLRVIKYNPLKVEVKDNQIK